VLQRVGEVLGMADGKVCVRWASGRESQLPPQVPPSVAVSRASEMLPQTLFSLL